MEKFCNDGKNSVHYHRNFSEDGLWKIMHLWMSKNFARISF
jgi:hypothetical protein